MSLEANFRLAVSESLKSPLCVIYDLLTFKKRKTLTLPASGIGAVSAAQKVIILY
jgi:hypothetical protein